MLKFLQEELTYTSPEVIRFQFSFSIIMQPFEIDRSCSDVRSSRSVTLFFTISIFSFFFSFFSSLFRRSSGISLRIVFTDWSSVAHSVFWNKTLILISTSSFKVLFDNPGWAIDESVFLPKFERAFKSVILS